jgi:hypothetical protein
MLLLASEPDTPDQEKSQWQNLGLTLIPDGPLAPSVLIQNPETAGVRVFVSSRLLVHVSV